MRISSLYSLLAGMFFVNAAWLSAEESSKPVFANSITTTDGKVYNKTTITRRGATILIKVEHAETQGSVEIGLPVSRIEKVDFPQPTELEKAREAASKGDALQVIKVTDDFVINQIDYKDLPGSWWSSMAEIRLLAQASIGNEMKVANLARQLGSTRISDAESIGRGGTLFAALAAGDTQAVVVGADALPHIGGGEGSALAQLALGRAFASKKEFEKALKAFLTIKVFYPSFSLLQPAALFGAGEAYAAIRDHKRAVQSFNDLVSQWPASPQVSDAKKRAKSLAHFITTDQHP